MRKGYVLLAILILSLLLLRPCSSSRCPVDTLGLAPCVDLVHGEITRGTTEACCTALVGLSDLESALCMRAVMRAKLLDVEALMPTALESLVRCGKHPPMEYQCPDDKTWVRDKDKISPNIQSETGRKN